MSRVIKLTNRQFAESYHQHLKDSNATASLETEGNDFVIKHEIAAACCEAGIADKPLTREEMYSVIDSMYRAMYGESKYLAESIDRLYNVIAAHMEGHLPKIQGAEKMQKALEALSLDGDYQVMKPVVFASDNRGQKTAVVDFINKK